MGNCLSFSNEDKSPVKPATSQKSAPASVKAAPAAPAPAPAPTPAPAPEPVVEAVPEPVAAPVEPAAEPVAAPADVVLEEVHPYLKYGGSFAGDTKDTDKFKYVQFTELPAFTPGHKSLMAKYLTPEVFEKLKDIKSSHGYSLSNVIQTGELCNISFYI